MKPLPYAARSRQRGFIINPFFGAGGVETDPYFSYVVNLSHFDGTHGTTSPVCINSCPNGNQFGGTSAASFSNTQVVYGSTSLRTTGTTSSYADAATDADYAIGTQDFVFEFWLRPDTVTGGQVYVDMRPAAEGAYPAIYASGSSLRYYVNSADRISGSVMAATTWQFVAVARTGSTTRMYRGTSGTAAQVGSDYADSTNYAQSKIRLGLGGFTTGPAAMYMDDFRFTVGHGRGYTGATIPIPTAPFPNS